MKSWYNSVGQVMFFYETRYLSLGFFPESFECSLYHHTLFLTMYCHLRLHLPRSLFLRSLRIKVLSAVIIVLACYMSRPFHRPLFDQSYNIRQIVQILKISFLFLITSTLLDPNILIGSVFWNTPNYNPIGWET